MRRALAIVLVVELGLGLFTWLGYEVAVRTARSWFVGDLELRAQLVTSSTRAALLGHWSSGRAHELTALLQDISRDSRILGVAACDPAGAPIATTADYPPELGCSFVQKQLLAPGATSASEDAFATTFQLDRGEVHVSGNALREGDRVLGTLVLVHDLSFVARRAERARGLAVAAFAMLALVSAFVTLLSTRLAARSWIAELRRMLRGDDQSGARPEFKPLLKDVRELVRELSSERSQARQSGPWTAERLKSALKEHLFGERIVIVANREPYIHQRGKDGAITVQHPASGLVTALEPVMRACSGVWVAHGSGEADRETVDASDRVRVPPGEESYMLRRVWMNEAEEAGYYYGFSNEGLWPLCHVAHTRPVFRADDFEQYRAINRRFADAVCEEVDSADPIVLVQDYHFALAPRMIRERLPKATILTFWHVPWPNAERFGICPWREELLHGLLGSSILGFHTQLHCNNFLDAVDSYVESRIDRERNAVVQGRRETLVRPYPIATEWPVRWLADLPTPSECRSQLIAELGLGQDALIGVGVDRLDYTKGIEERLLAVERLLDKHPELRGRFCFLQLAAPSRTKLGIYQKLGEAVEATARRINEKHGRPGYEPIILLRTHHEPNSVFRYYRAADVCYVSSLHDGMNLVAKEFVAAREDERGVLVLSQFTGAARELSEALIVNPYDLEEASDALATAVQMAPEEQRERMRSMRSLVSQFNVYRWAGRMLVDAAELRRRERITGRISRLGMQTVVSR